MRNKNIKLAPRHKPINAELSREVSLVDTGKHTYLWIGGKNYFWGIINGRELKQLALNILKRMDKDE